MNIGAAALGFVLAASVSYYCYTGGALSLFFLSEFGEGLGSNLMKAGFVFSGITLAAGLCLMKIVKSNMYYISLYQYGIQGKAANGTSFEFLYPSVTHVEIDSDGLVLAANGNRYVIPMQKQFAEFYEQRLKERIRENEEQTVLS